MVEKENGFRRVKPRRSTQAVQNPTREYMKEENEYTTEVAISNVKYYKIMTQQNIYNPILY